LLGFLATFSGQYVQAFSNTNQHYQDERALQHRTSEPELTLNGPAGTNIADLQNRFAGESRWAGSIPVCLRNLASKQAKQALVAKRGRCLDVPSPSEFCPFGARPDELRPALVRMP
jgi:hypothetical protein